jgi:hypothetical protein
MKKLLFIIFTLFIIQCSSDKNEVKIKEIFNDTFGKENTQLLDKIVAYSDDLLMQVYEVNEVSKAYELFLTDIKNNKLAELDIGLPLNKTHAFIDLFEQDSLKFNIWEFSVIDGRDVYSVNFQGKYFMTIEKTKEFDEFALKYYDTLMAAGDIYLSSVAAAILDEDIQLDNYLIKQIIVVNFLYRNLTNTAYNSM